MATLMEWTRRNENDPRILLPRNVEMVAERKRFSEQYGKRHAKAFLDQANEQHTANVRRTRAVLVGMATVREKLASDPSYTARRAASDMETLRAEYTRLAQDLPRLALKVEDARAIDADPITWAEQQLARFPALADRLPPLPAF